MAEKCWFHLYCHTSKWYSKNSGIYEHCMALSGVENSLDFLNQKLQTLLEDFSPTCLSNPPLLQPTASELALAYWHANWGNCSQGAALASSSHCTLLHTVSLPNQIGLSHPPSLLVGLKDSLMIKFLDVFLAHPLWLLDCTGCYGHIISFVFLMP